MRAEGSDCVDAVVIGAGIIGSAIALELSRGGRRVTVLDREAAPGHGSTSASSAIVRFHYSHLDEAVVAWEAAHRWRNWLDHLGVADPTGLASFVPCGLLLLDGSLVDVHPALSNFEVLGISVEQLDGDAIRERFPAIDPVRLGPPSRPDDDDFWADGRDDLVGYWMPGAGFVDDPQLAAHNLAHAASANGASFLTHAQVTEVRRENDRVIGVRLADGRRIDAPVVVNAAGPWSASLNRLAGVLGDFTTSTRPLLQEVISLPAPIDFRLGNGGVCVTDADFGTYFRPAGGDTLLVGGMEPPCDPLEWLREPDDARLSVSAQTWEVQSLRLARRLPSTRLPHTSSGVVGVYDVTDDWIPIYDRTSLDGYYVAIGTSGHAFKQAPFVGELMACLIDACESGDDHDTSPVQAPAPVTGTDVDLGHFSRRRTVRRQHGMG